MAPAIPKYYKVLGLQKTATDDEIKKAYRKMVLKYHPDKNPNGLDKYQEIQRIYEVLSNPEKRQRYDAYGERGVGKQKQNQPMQKERERSRDVVHPLKVSLEEMFNGTEKKLSLNRRRCCEKCHGAGGFGTQQVCTVCSGMGVQYRHSANAQHMVVPVGCPGCLSTGKIFQTPCGSCGGKRYWQEKKIMTVCIDKGMPEGKVITLRGEADQEYEKDTGDVIIELVSKDHDRFQRLGNDLFIKMEISMKEAYCGFSREIRGLGKAAPPFKIVSKPCQVIKDLMMYNIKNEGFPFWRDPFQRGNLIIQFAINEYDKSDYEFFMKNIADAKTVFPVATPDIDHPDAEEVEAIEYDPVIHDTAFGDCWAEDDDGPHKGVRCQNQ